MLTGWSGVLGECLEKLLLVSDVEELGLRRMGSRYCLGLERLRGLSSWSLLGGGGVVEDLPDRGA